MCGAAPHSGVQANSRATRTRLAPQAHGCRGLLAGDSHPTPVNGLSPHPCRPNGCAPTARRTSPQNRRATARCKLRVPTWAGRKHVPPGRAFLRPKRPRRQLLPQLDLPHPCCPVARQGAAAHAPAVAGHAPPHSAQLSAPSRDPRAAPVLRGPKSGQQQKQQQQQQQQPLPSCSRFAARWPAGRARPWPGCAGPQPRIASHPTMRGEGQNSIPAARQRIAKCSSPRSSIRMRVR